MVNEYKVAKHGMLQSQGMNKYTSPNSALTNDLSIYVAC